MWKPARGNQHDHSSAHGGSLRRGGVSLPCNTGDLAPKGAMTTGPRLGWLGLEVGSGECCGCCTAKGTIDAAEALPPSLRRATSAVNSR